MVEEINFGFIGRWIWLKGLYEILNAFPILATKWQNCTLQIVGGNQNSYGGGDMCHKYPRVPIGKFVHETCMHHRLTRGMKMYCSEKIHPKDVPKFLESIDVFLLPTCETGNPIALFEAMATGKICITTNQFDYPHIQDGKTAIVCEKSVDSVYKKMLYVCQNFEELKILGENAREHVMKHKSWPVIIPKFEKEYEKVLV